MSYYDYYNGRSSRTSHTGGDSHNVSGSHSSPHPTQQHPTYAQQQQYHPSAQPQAQAAYGQTSYSSSPYQLPHDPRHQSGQAYNYRGSPSSNSQDRRRLPPLDVPGVPSVPQDRWPSTNTQYYHPDLQMQPTANDIRSPHPSMYSPQPAAGYPQHQSLTYTQTHTSPYISSSSRGSMPVAAPANPHHHHSIPMGPSSVDRTPHIPRNSAQLPYARNAPDMAPMASPVEDLSEPTIKKKRKRADARQLEVLNATYNRTAFPSTEERAALAKQLDMSARSVQIWFQNKRQAMRQGGRTTNPATTPVSSAGPAPPPVPTPTPPVYRGPSPAVTATSRMMQHPGIAYGSRSPPPPPQQQQPMRTGHTPSPPSGRSRDDRRNWPQQQSRGGGY
jgi:homeobox protein YOX1/YHP1